MGSQSPVNPTFGIIVFGGHIDSVFHTLRPLDLDLTDQFAPLLEVTRIKSNHIPITSVVQEKVHPSRIVQSCRITCRRCRTQMQVQKTQNRQDYDVILTYSSRPAQSVSKNTKTAPVKQTVVNSAYLVGLTSEVKNEVAFPRTRTLEMIRSGKNATQIGKFC